MGINRNWGDSRHNIYGFRYDNKPFQEVSCEAEKGEETVSLPLSLFGRKQQRLLAERQPRGYSSCLQICDHKKSLSL